MEATVATRTPNLSILTLTVRMSYFNLMYDRLTISISLIVSDRDSYAVYGNTMNNKLIIVMKSFEIYYITVIIIGTWIA
jgi:hypothetical protein